MGSFADALSRFAQPLIDDTDGSPEQLQQALKLSQLCRAGDERAVLPLIAAIIDGPEAFRANAMCALTGIAHRLGRHRLGRILLGQEGVP